MYDLSTALDLWAKRIKESVNTCLPARVVKVNNDGTVNVVAIRNDYIDDCVITVPVIRPETKRAYIYLGMSAGDRGIVKFCDKSIESYRQTGSEENTNDDRVHSLSDGVFQLGFLPENEKFVFPNKEIAIGLKNNEFTLSVDASGELTIKAKKITINTEQTDLTSPTINITGDINLTGNMTATGTITAPTLSGTTNVTGGSISLNSHTHGGVTSGNSQTGVPQ